MPKIAESRITTKTSNAVKSKNDREMLQRPE